MLIRKVLSLFRLTWRDRLLLIQVFILTGLVRIAILLVPFRILAGILGELGTESSIRTNEVARAFTKKVGWSVRLVSRYTPWQSKCLVQALTGQIMLRAHKIDCTLYLGVARDKKSHLVAHAWLRSGTDIITGEPEHAQFAVVAQFASGIGGRDR